MKFRYVLIMLVALAGFGASLALADDGHGTSGENGAGKESCKHGAVLGTVSAPQSLTLTVVKASDKTGFKAGQTVTLSIGSQGQQVRIVAEGCVGTDGTITVHEAELHARNPNAGKHEGHEHGDTTTTTDESTTTTTGDSTTTTTQK